MFRIILAPKEPARHSVICPVGNSEVEIPGDASGPGRTDLLNVKGGVDLQDLMGRPGLYNDAKLTMLTSEIYGSIQFPVSLWGARSVSPT
jgi:hypothetical protein